jgi:hypothetical protein
MNRASLRCSSALFIVYIFLPLDQAWLDAINVERKKDQLNAVSYETFEIIIDRLEKEWFDLVRQKLSASFCSRCDNEPRPRTSQSTTLLSHPRTLHVRFAMTRKSKTATLSSFVMDATWPFIRVSRQDSFADKLVHVCHRMLRSPLHSRRPMALP